MSPEDYWKASLKHWLLQGLVGKLLITDTPSATAGPVLHPDVDSTRSGQVYYEYQGQTDSTQVGTQKRVTRVVWHGATSITLDIARNDWGRPTNITHYYNGNAVTYANTYNPEGRTLQSVLGPRGEPVRGYGYPTNLHRLLTSVTNALGEVTRYTHNTNGMKLTSITYPGGLVTTNLYYTSGTYTGFLAQTLDQGFRTNSFGYLNGNIAIQTNELGLITTNTLDGLDRLAAVKFPDGTYTSNRWDKLDLTGTRDRLGAWTTYKFNPVRQLIALTNANGAATTYGYCGCGSPSEITTWNGGTPLVTTFNYNLAGQLTNATYQDGYQLSYTYDDLERLLTVLDSGGHQL